ncbi:MAG TPA: Holliday junction branch migration protein RuvA [Chitinophagaceae bacterium]|jgi:Holliday junction DNA helicase RuvA|nr:Holliday junction branch migration protein RuvA [Chitinophagaceae bacterium]
MIAYVKGDFVLKTPALVHVDVHGVGYEVQISLNTFSRIQALEKGILYTFLHIKEDSHTLYGFFEVAEKDMFIKLIGISGVGAATARMMLSSMKPEEIARAIINGNARLLESIKGIGKKSAERIILELKDKLSRQSTEANFSPGFNNTIEQDALNALMSLGIQKPAAEQAIRKVLTAAPGSDKVEDIIKQALKIL